LPLYRSTSFSIGSGRERVDEESTRRPGIKIGGLKRDAMPLGKDIKETGKPAFRILEELGALRADSVLSAYMIWYAKFQHRAGLRLGAALFGEQVAEEF
jgi:hypothetical protein